ncbi:MAG: FtsK/SpoIIIE domain-containing protein [Anaerolineae bacterium]
MLETESFGLAQARLRHHLEMQSLIIEETVSRYSHWPLRVSGGNVRANRIWYELPLDSAVLPARTIEFDLQEKLGVAAQVSQGAGRLRVVVERPSPSVDLLTLMQQYKIPAPGALTAVLGLDSAGMPVQLDLNRAGHVLLAGSAASGKTALLQTIAISLALANPSQQLQFLVIQPDSQGDLRLLDGLPHDFLLRQVITSAATAVPVLQTLCHQLENRALPANGQAVGGPHLVILLEQIERLLAIGFDILQPLVRLLGANGPFTLLVSTQQPQNELLRYCGDRWGTRLVGQVADANQAEAATGLPSSRAEQLLGDGSFLLVRRGDSTPHYFQAAYADRYDLSFLARRKHDLWMR